MTNENSALWLLKRGGPFEVGPAPYTRPGPDEVVVQARAIAVNPIDGMPVIAYRLILPWLKFPAVIGYDVAGEVFEVGERVTRLKPGDRVVGIACGTEKSRNRPAEGGFQQFPVLMEHMVTPIPDSLSFEKAAVLPLALSTAAVGLFQKDHLGLPLPTADPVDQLETVLVWGGSTSVGSNAIQLARNAGYRVVATASPHNFGYLRSLGAAETADYRSPTVIDELVTSIGDSPLAGSIAIGSGALPKTIKVAARTEGSKRVTSAQAGLIMRIEGRGARRHGIKISAIWGGSLKDNEVGPGIYVDFLPAALASGAYHAAPEAVVVGHGLAMLPEALQQLKAGVSAKKLVVTV